MEAVGDDDAVTGRAAAASAGADLLHLQQLHRRLKACVVVAHLLDRAGREARCRHPAVRTLQGRERKTRGREACAIIKPACLQPLDLSVNPVEIALPHVSLLLSLLALLLQLFNPAAQLAVLDSCLTELLHRGRFLGR